MRLSLKSKKNLCWVLFFLCLSGGGASLFYSPLIWITYIGLPIMAIAFRSFESDAMERIDRYETPYTVQDLVRDSFPPDNNKKNKVELGEIRRLMAPDAVNRAEQVKILQETWSREVFFSDASSSVLAIPPGNKEEMEPVQSKGDIKKEKP